MVKVIVLDKKRYKNHSLQNKFLFKIKLLLFQKVLYQEYLRNNNETEPSELKPLYLSSVTPCKHMFFCVFVVFMSGVVDRVIISQQKQI